MNIITAEDRAARDGVDVESVDRELNDCEARDGAVQRLKDDFKRGLSLLIPPKPDAVADYQRERALIDARTALDGLDETSIECLSFGQITGRAVQLVAWRMSRTGINVGAAVDWSRANDLAFGLTELMKAAKLVRGVK